MNLLVGTFSQSLPAMNAYGSGIYTVSFDKAAIRFGKPELIAACINPTALAFDSASRTVFASREVFAADSPAVVSFSLHDGLAKPLSELPLKGELPCHVAFDPNSNCIASAQYWTGDVALCGVREGRFQGESTSLQNEGSGPNEVRQQGPHAHCVVFSDNGSALHVVDLGADLIVSYRLESNCRVVEKSSLRIPAGSGPRHIVMNRDESRAFVICELSEELVTLRRRGLGWEIEKQQKAFNLPEGVNGSAAAIRLSEDDRFLYISGRRESQIALFDVAETPRFIQEFDTGGICPREFMVSECGQWIICGNQDSGTVTALQRNPLDGTLSPAMAQCEIGSAVAILET